MRVRFTVGDDHAGELLEVSSAGQATWSDVVPHLPVPWCRHPQWYAVGRPGAAPVALSGEEVVGRPPLLDGVHCIAAPVPAQAPAAPVTLRVCEGPDCGALVDLRPGHRLTVGRSPGCDLTIADGGLSRHHVTVWTSRGGVIVEDASSTNGTLHGAEQLQGPTSWAPGTPLRAGGSRLELVRHTVSLDRAPADGEGGLTLTPRRAPLPPITDVEIRLPSPPDPAVAPSPPVLSWVIPLLVSGLLALLLRMPMLLLFGVMAPALTLGSHLTERRRHRADTRRAQEQYRAKVRQARADASAAVASELQVRRERVPDLADLRARVRDAPSSGVWARAPDRLLVRLGTADQASRVHVDGGPLTLPDAPFEVDLRGGLVVVGPVDAGRALVRSLLCQVLVEHGPDTVTVHVLGSDTVQPPLAHPDDPVWGWLSWAPHLQAQEDSPPPAPASSVLVLDDRHGSGTGSGLQAVDGLVPIVLIGPDDQAPALASVVRIADDGSLEIAGSTVRGDLISQRCARDITRCLASLRVARGAAGPGIPEQVHFAETDPAVTAADLVHRWRRVPRSTRFVLGVGDAGPCELDLVADGPHALVGGTTGSGKSELLRTLVTSLALANRPDELVFVLVDYKGGSAFAEAAQLPHTVGLITDLDPHLADRALTSLGAELKRRERVLAAAGARDLADYQRRDGPPLARLVLVIDEFRALAEELPTFLDGLVRIAALGRSLGVHLVLATQRPGGIVSADVRANVNLRIALRVRDAADSHDVIDSAEAATLPERLPGRALVRTGARPPRRVQVARVSEPIGRPDNGAERIRIRRMSESRFRLPTPAPTAAPCAPGDPAGESLLSRLSVEAGRAAAQLSCSPPPSPWLQPLPEVLPRATLTSVGPRPETSSTRAHPRSAVLFAQADLPAQQEQRPIAWDPVSDGHLAVVGAPRTGRSSLLRTLLAGLLEGAGPDEAHLYGFDPAGALAPLAKAPHTGAWVGPDEVPRGMRVLEVLADTTARRQQALAAEGFTSIVDQHAAAGRPGGPAALPVVCLVVDGWPRFLADYGEVERGRGAELVTHLLREGPSAGVVALLTGDRSLLTSRVAALVNSTWCLRMTDPQDLLMSGLTRRQVPDRMPPGRMVRLPDGLVAQAAVLGTDPAGDAQVRELGAFVGSLTDGDEASGGQSRRLPVYVRQLPRQVTFGELLPKACPVAGEPTGLLVGVGGDDAGPVWLPVDPAIGGTALVSGPPRSGRTTALRTMGAAAEHGGHPTLFVDGDRAVREPDVVLAELRACLPGVVVAVDDAAALADGPVEDALLDLARALPTTGGAVLLGGEPEELSGSYRGLAPLAARGRTGILLQPSGPADGAPLGVSPGAAGHSVPGRGLLVARGRVTVVQVAIASTSATDPARDS